MPRVPFDELPDSGRLWVFPASRSLTPPEVDRLLSEVDAFLDGWAAHGTPLRAGRHIVEGHFLMVAVDLEAAPPSGCSIDALVNRLRAAGDDLDVALLDHGPVWFRDGGRVRSESRAEFRALAAERAVDPDTPVFDTTLTRLSDLRDGNLERPARETWHGRAFFPDPATR